MKCKNCGHYIQKHNNIWFHAGYYGFLKELNLDKFCNHGKCFCNNPQPKEAD
jgi:hypothetical protein